MILEGITVSAGNLYIATNEDKSIFKFYTTGLFIEFNPDATQGTIKIKTDIIPNEKIVIGGAGIQCFENATTSSIGALRGLDFTLDIDGTITISTVKASSSYIRNIIILFSNLYFAKNFGDVPVTPNV